MKQATIDQALGLLRQYRDILVASYAPLAPGGVPQPRTLEQASDPLELAALNDIALLDEIIKEMSA
ncbi:hypothetical protein [Mesorhizobium sp. WSM2561]|uniref:hypothetical protein n=1 Tax=Mesorhizobium sp. WSM2561 TaxID=1040985 RepID=UPI000485F827|nr:hypothetical protein [Mesorhizobium sp. WSM2561]